jgi:mRNA interferase MazF
MIKGNIILVPFPFDDLTTTKVRPAICLTEPIGIHRHVVIAFITSQIPSDLLDTDVAIDIAQPNFVSTGLRVTSVLRLHRLVTISTSIIRRHLGSVSGDIQREVDQKLRQLFGLHHISNSIE